MIAGACSVYKHSRSFGPFHMGIYKSKTIYSCNNSISETYIYIYIYTSLSMYGIYA